MILIDTNALVVLLVGMVDINLINHHKRTSIYEETDFDDLINIIGKIENLVVLPNIWTEVDNLLNNFKGNHRYTYIEKIKDVIKSTSEKYISSSTATSCDTFFSIGLTDSLVIEEAKKCDLLITSDSSLADYAKGYGIKVYDMVKARNERI